MDKYEKLFKNKKIYIIKCIQQNVNNELTSVNRVIECTSVAKLQHSLGNLVNHLNSLHYTKM